MSAGSEIKNGKITSTTLGLDRDIFLVFWIQVQSGCMGQVIGGRVLAVLGRPGDGYGKGFNAIAKLLDVVGVEKWEDLNGQLIRIDWRGSLGDSTPPRIGNILEEKWWDIEVEMRKDGE